MRVAAVLLLVLLAGLPPGAAADGGALGVTSTAFDFQGVAAGDTRVARTTVQNSFDRTLRVEVQTAGALAPYVTATPAAFTLGAGEHREVRLDLALPASIPPAAYRAAVRFVGDAVGAPDGSGNTLRTAVGASLAATFAAPHVSAVSVVPASLDVNADDRAPRRFTVTATDTAGRAVAVDASRWVSWTVDPAAGSFAGNVFTPSGRAGLFTVRGTFLGGEGVDAVSALRVAAGAVARLEASPAALTVVRGASASVVVRAFDAADNAVQTPPLAWASSASNVAVVDRAGKVTGQGTGTATVEAADAARGLTASVAVTVVSNTRPVASLVVSPSSATLAAGSQQRFTVRALDDTGAEVDGATTTFSLQDPLGDVDASGTFTARRVGSTHVVVRAGAVEASVPVTVVAGALAQLRLVPEAAFLPAGGSTRFVATGLDAQGNAVDAAVSWRVAGASGGTVSDDGTYVAGSSGTAHVTATSGVVSREAVVFQASTTTGGGAVEAAVATSTADTLETTTWVAGLASVEPDTNTTITAPLSGGDGARMASATMRVGRPATDLAVSIAVQPGSFDVVPPEVDAGDLVRSRASTPPALFISVQASEGGTALDADGLNAVLESIEVRFDVPESYFTDSDLDPTTLHLVEYSEGRLVRDDVPTVLLTPTPVDGRYSYVATLDEFSSFAAVAEESADDAPGGGSGGGAGGGRGGGRAPLAPVEGPAPRVAISLAKDGRSCLADVPCRERSWTVALAVNVLGLDASRPWRYVWDLGDGNTSSDPSPEHRYATRGVHVVTVEVGDGRTRATGRQPVLVQPPLAVDVVAYDGGFEIRLDEPVRSVEVLLGGEPVRKSDAPQGRLQVADPRLAGDERSLVLDVTDVLGEVHHVILPVARTLAPVVAKPVQETAVEVPRGRAPPDAYEASPASDAPPLPVAWWLSFVAVAAGVGLVLAHVALRRQDDDDRFP